MWQASNTTPTYCIYRCAKLVTLLLIAASTNAASWQCYYLQCHIHQCGKLATLLLLAMSQPPMWRAGNITPACNATSTNVASWQCYSCLQCHNHQCSELAMLLLPLIHWCVKTKISYYLLILDIILCYLGTKIQLSMNVLEHLAQRCSVSFSCRWKAWHQRARAVWMATSHPMPSGLSMQCSHR